MSTNITIIGIGKLGLCVALVMAHSGFNVVGVDVTASYVNSLQNRTFTSPEPQANELLQSLNSAPGTFIATTDVDAALSHSNLVWILVATPTGTTDESTYDHTALGSVLQAINDRKVENKHIIIGCTVMPGYIAHVGKSLLDKCTNTTLSYNPEFIAQGNIIYGLRNPDVVLIGEANIDVGDKIMNIYNKVVVNTPKVCKMSVESAEIAKLALNCFITTKISFANFIMDVAANTSGANAQQILACVGADSRVGSKCLNVGFGFGGPCFPRDNRALGMHAKAVGITPFIPEATDNSNKEHAHNLAERIAKQWEKKKTTISFSDVCYKPNCTVPIIEESQSLAVAKLLHKRGVGPIYINDKAEVIRLVKNKFGGIFEYIVAPENSRTV